MTIRNNLPFSAVYIFEPLGHNVPALNTTLSAGGPIRIEASTTDESLVCGFYGVSTGTLNYWGLFKNASSDNVELRGYNGSLVTSGTYSLPPGQYHLSIEHQAGTVRARLDGVVILSMSFTPLPGTLGDRSFQIAGYGEDAGIVDCSLERWRMWTAVLTEAEWRAEFRAMSPMKLSGLIHNWPMAWPNWGLDTVAGQPAMVDNPAAPVSSASAIILYPTMVAAPVFYDLGQTTTPGAQSVTVPTWAEYVGIHIVGTDNTSAPYVDLTSLTANFTGTIARANAPAIATSAGGWVATAPVTNFTAGRTFTPVFSEGNPLAGANAFAYFIQDTLGATARGTGQATGDGTTPGVASASGTVNGLSVALDTRLNATAGSYPANQSGWTSVDTDETTGAFGYWASGRLRDKNIASTGTETATTQTTFASVITLATWTPRPLTIGATLNRSTNDATLVATATHPARGTLAKTTDNATLLATGTVVFPSRNGTLSRTTDNATVSASAGVRLAGALSKGLDNATLSGAATHSVSGVLARTTDQATLSAIGTVGSTPISGGLVRTTDNATLSAVALHSVLGSFSRAADNATLLSAASHPVLALLSRATDNASLVSSGQTRSSATLAKTADNATLSATGVVGSLPIIGIFSKVADNATLSAVASHRVAGSLSRSTDNASLLSLAAIAERGTLARVTDNATLNASGSNSASGSLAKTTDAATLQAFGTVVTQPAISGGLVQTLQDATVLARGTAAGEIIIQDQRMVARPIRRNWTATPTRRNWTAR